MAVEKNPKLRFIDVPLNKGINEISPTTKVPLSGFLQLHNFRIAEDGQRIEKVDGVAAIGANASIGAKDVFGFTTYYDGSSNFCQLIITEDKIWRKIGAAAWATIHTWASTLAHPVKVHEIQGKQVIVTEIENIMILSGGTKVQLGITAPATIPTLTETIYDTSNVPLDEDFDYANDTALAAGGWTDEDSSGTSTMALANPTGGAGPDADTRYLRLYDGSPGSGRYAQRSKTIPDVGSKYTLELDVYLEKGGYPAWNGRLHVYIYNGSSLVEICLSTVWAEYHNGSGYVTLFNSYPGDSAVDRWYNYKYVVDASNPMDITLTAYKDDVEIGTGSINRVDSTANKITIKQETGDATYGDGDTYLDHVKITSEASGGGLNGKYRYAVTYRRRETNYSGESNPIKALVGSATITGAGLDDMTTGGTYTGDKDRTIRVRIDGTGTPDTIEWSEDAGDTWITADMPVTSTMYLPWGIELTWAATTGHTSGDYWAFACSSLALSPTNKKITLTSIPVSSDSQVTQRRIWRTTAGGTTYFLLATLNDNTTTSYVDNMPDSALGATMKEDADIAPLGKFSAWWDDRLWIGTSENILYRSRVAVPDAFDTSGRYVSVRRGQQDEALTGIIEFQSHLYAFERDYITLVRKKLSGSYGRYEVSKDTGNIAPWSLLEVRGLLLFVSERGWEAFNGQSVYPAKFSVPIRTTLNTIDKTKLDLITTAHHKKKNEVYLSLPDRTGGESAVILVCNHEVGEFYTRSVSKTASALCLAKDSSKVEQLYVGTRDGYVGTCESGTQDFGSNISAYGRLPWIYDSKKEYLHLRRSEFEYEALDDITLTVTYYANFDKDVRRTLSLAGNTPSATDQDLRRPIFAYDEPGGIHGQYFSLKFANAENTGSTLKIHDFRMYYVPMGKKRGIEAD